MACTKHMFPGMNSKRYQFRLVDGARNSYHVLGPSGLPMAIIRGRKAHTVPGEAMWAVRPLVGRKVAGMLYRGLTLGTAIDLAIFTYNRAALTK